MRKIYFHQDELFEIAKIVKNYFPDIKIFLHRHDTRIVLNLPRNVERIKIEELKTLFKIRYPNYQIIFYSE
jgi:phosphatidate phosphatase APP1